MNRLTRRTFCLLDGRVCTSRPAGAIGYLVSLCIPLWPSICIALNGEEVRNDDHTYRSSGVVCARWRGMGIFSLARVAPAGSLTAPCRATGPPAAANARDGVFAVGPRIRSHSANIAAYNAGGTVRRTQAIWCLRSSPVPCFIQLLRERPPTGANG